MWEIKTHCGDVTAENKTVNYYVYIVNIKVSFNGYEFPVDCCYRVSISNQSSGSLCVGFLWVLSFPPISQKTCRIIDV